MLTPVQQICVYLWMTVKTLQRCPCYYRPFSMHFVRSQTYLANSDISQDFTLTETVYICVSLKKTLFANLRSYCSSSPTPNMGICESRMITCSDLCVKRVGRSSPVPWQLLTAATRWGKLTEARVLGVSVKAENWGQLCRGWSIRISTWERRLCIRGVRDSYHLNEICVCVRMYTVFPRK